MALEDRILTLSKLKSYNSCPHKFNLEENRGYNRIPLSLRAAASRFFQQERKEMFEVKDERKLHFPRIQRRAGKFLPDVEQMTSEELREFMPASSSEAFGNRLAYGSKYPSFKRIIERQVYSGRDLASSYEAEQGSTTLALRRAFQQYAEFSIAELAPVISLFDFITYTTVADEKLGINIGELRPRNIDGKYFIFVDQPTFGPFSTGKFSNGVEDSPLVTLTLMAITDLITNYRLPQLQLSMPEAFVEHLNNERPAISPRLVYRNINFGGEEAVITETKRVSEDALKAEALIIDITNKIRNKEFEPKTQNCGSCHLSSLDIAMKPLCNESHSGSSNQSYIGIFTPKNYEITIEETINGFELICKAPVRADGVRSLVELARQEVIIEEINKSFVVSTNFDPVYYEASGKIPHFTMPYKRMYREARREIKERLGNKKVRMITQVPTVKPALEFMKKRGFEETETGLEKYFS